MVNFKEYLSNNNQELLHLLIEECYNLKSKIVKIDERDQNIRKTLNLGHTFGHAIESDSKNQVSHGVAVTNGILMESFLSFKGGFLKKEEFKKIQETCSNLLKRKYITDNVDKFVSFMLNDKKNSNKKIGVIIVEKIGKVRLEYFTEKEIKELIKDYNEYISY